MKKIDCEQGRRPVVTLETWHVPTRDMENIPVAVKYRQRGEDLIVFMHGLGCAKESFTDAFTAEPLRPYSLLTFDFPEHGASGSLGAGADIASVAEVAGSVLGRMRRHRLHFVCHSMGGAIGLVAAQGVASVSSFICVEGNLVAADCGLVSRGIAEQRTEHFLRIGFASFVQILETSAERSHAQWAQWYRQCRPLGLHHLASSLVAWCDNDKLVGILRSLRSSAYVHGDQSEVGHLRECLDGIPMRAVTGSGHFPMVDNPGEFYGLIGELLDDMRASRSPVVSSSKSV